MSVPQVVEPGSAADRGEPTTPSSTAGRSVARGVPDAQPVGVPDRGVGADEQQVPVADRLQVAGEQSGEKRGKLDDPSASALGRAEVPAGVHVLVDRTDPWVDLVPSSGRVGARIGARLRVGQVQERVAHPAHLAPAHPGEQRDDHHQSALPRQASTQLQDGLEA